MRTRQRCIGCRCPGGFSSVVPKDSAPLLRKLPRLAVPADEPEDVECKLPFLRAGERLVGDQGEERGIGISIGVGRLSVEGTA